MGNTGKSNTKFGQKQWEIRGKAIIFARNICRRFPSFLIAFAQIFPLLLHEFAIAFARICHYFSPKFEQNNGKFGAKAISKLKKRRDIFQAKIMEVLGNFTNWHIIFKVYFLDQMKMLKDLASSARNSQYTWIYCIRFGRECYEKNRACYCEQVYNSYRLQEKSKLY